MIDADQTALGYYRGIGAGLVELRRQRVGRVWRRFMVAVAEESKADAATLSGNVSMQGQVQIMQGWIRKRAGRDWGAVIRTVLEAADLGLENMFAPREPRPTQAQPGSLEKVQELARRYEAGEELFGPGEEPT